MKKEFFVQTNSYIRKAGLHGFLGMISTRYSVKLGVYYIFHVNQSSLVCQISL